jgi:carboxyl-terminal processing protease
MRARALVVVGVLGGSLVSGGWLLGRGLGGHESAVSTSRLFDAVAIHVKRFYVDSVSDSALYDKAMIGMLQELDDPFTLYLTADRVRRLTEATTGNYVGIGANVQRRDNWPMVIAPFPGSPAERAGLRTGDRIVEIDGKKTQGWTVDETLRALRGPPGTTVQLALERPGSPRRLSFSLVRSGIHRRAVSRAILLSAGIGYIDVNTFNDSTDRELEQAVDSLNALGMRSLVLDLRGNPGGVLTQGVGVADMFLTKGQPIVTMRGRTPDMNQLFIATHTQRWPTLPLAVLIDEGSASAAEIVAGALQDHDRAVLVGRTSFGKGSAQTVFPIKSGGAVKLTTARWFTPSGRSIDRPVRHNDADGDEAMVRKTFRTDHGRAVVGGGGIVPDVTVGDTALTPAEQALEDALGAKVIAFRDAMTAYALQLKARGGVTTRDFVVTQQMLDGLWAMMRGRGFSFDRRIFDGASRLIARLLGREIARDVFGADAETERLAKEDEIIQTAVRLLSGATSTEQLLDRARQQGRARPN